MAGEQEKIVGKQYVAPTTKPWQNISKMRMHVIEGTVREYEVGEKRGKFLREMCGVTLDT